MHPRYAASGASRTCSFVETHYAITRSPTIDLRSPRIDAFCVLVRAAPHLRVHDTGYVTSVYRATPDQANSSDVHSPTGTGEAISILRTKLDVALITLPPRPATTLIELRCAAHSRRETIHARDQANERSGGRLRCAEGLLDVLEHVHDRVVVSPLRRGGL